MTDHLFTVDAEQRTVEGILLPYGEQSRLSVSGAEPITYAGPDDIDLTPDPSVVLLKDEHNTFAPLGVATELRHAPELGGVFARFTIARTPAGDAYLADPNRKRKLSPEIAGIIRRGAQGLGGLITGAAVTAAGAFAGAHLFALGEITERDDDTDPDDADDADDAEQPSVDSDTDSDTDTDTDADTDPDDTDPDKKSGAFAMTAPRIVPDHARTDAPTGPTLDGLFAALARKDRDALAQYASGDLFALSALNESGPDAVTNGANVAVPTYLGELWKRRKYNRRIVPLLAQAALTSYRAVGWRWKDGAEPTVGDYAGNGAEVPSGALDTEQVTSEAQRIAGGHKLDRRFVDFNDTAVIASYHEHMTEDYARKTDAKALAAVVAAATTTAPGAVPAGIAKGLAAIVDGALDVIAQENTPSFALVDPALWRDIILATDKQGVLTFLQASMGLEEGQLDGFKIRPATVGAAAGANKTVIVGAAEAMTFYELGGGAPIRVEGIDPLHGAIDPAVFGYWATIANNAKSIRKVVTA